MEYYAPKPIDSRAIYSDLRVISSIEENTDSFHETLNLLFLFFSSVANKSKIVASLFTILMHMQLLCSVCVLLIILNYYSNEDNYTCFLASIGILFYPSTSLNPNSFTHIIVIQILSYFSIFLFWLGLFKIKRHISISNAFIFVTYIVSIEIGRLLVIPNVFLTSRALFTSLDNTNTRYIVYTCLQLLITILLVFQTICLSIYYTSSFYKPSYMMSLFDKTPHYQVFVCVFICYLFCTYSTKTYATVVCSLAYFITAIIYFIQAKSLLFYSKFEIYSHFGYCGTYLYVFIIGILHLFYKFKLSIGLYTTLSFLVFFICYSVAMLVVRTRVKVYARKLESAATIEDLKIKNQNQFMHFIYISYFNASKLLLDGSFFKFALDHEEMLGTSTYIKLLRLMSSLPMNIPYINKIENKAFKYHRRFWFENFRIFEYKIIKKHRCKFNDKIDLEYYARMSSAIQKYAELINSSVSVIQHEKKSNIFIYGSSLSYLARKLEFYVKLMLLRYPNKLNFVKLGALFYERCVMNPLMARDLCNRYNAISVYEFPNWRELTTQDVYFKTLFDENEYSIEKNDEDLSFDSNEQALNQSLKSAISNDIVKFEIFNFTMVTIALHIIGFAFIFFVLCIIYSGTTLTQIYTGMLKLVDSLNIDLGSFLKLLIFAFEPCLPRTSSLNSSINLKNYLIEYNTNHQQFYKTLVSVLTSNRQLNMSLWSSFTSRYLESQTVTGDPFNFSYLTVGNRVITVVESMLFSDNCSDNLYYNYSQDFFLNLTNYVDNFDIIFQTSMGKVLSMIIRSATLSGEVGRAIVILSVFISLFTLLFYRMKFNKIRESMNEGKQTKESNLVTSMLSESNHKTVYYILAVICTLTVIILLYVLNVYIMYYVAKQTSDTSSHNIQDIFRELKQTFYIGCAITGLRLQLINPELRTKAKLNVEKAMRMISLTNRASSFNFSIILNISKIIARSYFENTTAISEDFIMNATYLFLTELMPSNLALIEARKLNITVNFNNISYYEVALHSLIFLISLILLSIVAGLLHHFIHSVLYSEMLTKLIPYIRTAVSEDGSNSVSGMNDNSFTLDLVGYPAAIVNSKDEIIFVNHLWLSAFNDVMSKFIGTNVNQYVTSAITGKDFDGLKVVVLEKSKEMDGLRKDVDEKKKEYKKIIKVLHPLESFTEEMKNRTAIVLSLNFIPLGEGDRSIEVDTCSFHSKTIISRLKRFVKPYNVRFLLWSFGELQLVFGLKDDDIKCAALNALSTAYYAIQMAIEGEEMFELSISALIMSGKFIDGSFDGREVRQNRFPNAVLLSQSVADLVVDYVCDMAYIYNGYIMINVDDRDIDDTEMEEDNTEDIMYI